MGVRVAHKTAVKMVLRQLSLLISQLKPLDRHVILLYIEDIGAEEIAAITGLSRGSVGVRIHRIKQLLSKMACAAVIMGVWFAMTIESILFRVGVFAMLAGVLYSLYEWRQTRATWSVTLEGSAVDGLQFYKRELARLRDLHRGLWKIYLPAAVPGAIILLAWMFMERQEPNERTVLTGFALAIWLIVMLRHEAQVAKRYHRELDALESKN